MARWEDARQRVKRTQVSVRVPMASDLVDEHERLAGDLRRAREADEHSNVDPTAPGIAERMQDLERQIADSEWEFSFVGIGRGEYTRLLGEHKPTPAQTELANQNGLTLEFNSDTFPPALLARSAVRVVMADGEVVEGVDWREIWDTWSLGQTTRIWRTCLAANSGVAETPKSVAASAVMLASGRS